MSVVELPVYYSSNVRRRKHRSWSNVWFKVPMEFELAEGDDEDYPIAADGLPRLEEHVRWDGEAFWTPDVIGPRAALPPAEWARFLMNSDVSPAWKSHSAAFGAHLNLHKYAHVPNLDEFRDPKGDTLQEGIARTSEFVQANLRLINGTVYRRCREPVIKLAHESDLTSRPLSASVSFGMDKPKGFATWFRLTRAEDAAATVKATGGDADAVTRPRVILPHAFVAPDEARSLRSVAVSFVSATSFGLSEMNDDTGEAWFRMRAALRTFETDLADEIYGDVLADRIEELLATLKGPLPGQYTLYGAYQPAQRAVERWRMRPMELGLTLG